MRSARSVWSPILPLVLLVSGRAAAQTIFVDTATDATDFGGAQQVADLPGPDGRISLAEAAIASDNTPGVQTIGFHVPQNEWQYQWLYPGRAVLTIFLGLTLFDTVILDATTQTAFTGDTNPAGGEVVIFSGVFLNNGSGSAVRGFDHTAISVAGGSAQVLQGNSESGFELWDVSNALIGGTNPGEGNSGGTIKLTSSSHNVVVGNRVQRVRVLGNGPFQPPTLDNRIGGPALAERNFITGSGSISSQGIPGGVAVEIFDADGTTIENNWIGTTPDGLAQGHPYTTIGIAVWGDVDDNTVLRNNRIAGVRALALPPHSPSYYVGTGIVIGGGGSGLTIVGNTIGLDANGAPLLGSVTGITTVNFYLGQKQNVVLGGSAPGEGNEIAGNDRQGILLSNGYSGVRLSGNSIHDNGELGIDLVDAGFVQGVSPNDALDADAGANGLQNFPLLQAATRTSSTLRVQGTLNSSASSSFTLEFFASPGCDASGFGEGRVFVGSVQVTTNAGGDAGFDVTLPASLAPGWSVTATATSATDSTSEFSACVGVQDAPGTGVPFCFGDGSAGACPCGNSGASGRGCENSASTGGALLAGTGTPSLANDTLVLDSSGELPSVLSILLQGSTSGPAAAFGDGLRCAGARSSACTCATPAAARSACRSPGTHRSPRAPRRWATRSRAARRATTRCTTAIRSWASAPHPRATAGTSPPASRSSGRSDRAKEPVTMNTNTSLSSSIALLLFAAGAHARQAGPQVTITELPLLPGGTYASAYGINDTGRIVGVANDASGNFQNVQWVNGQISVLPAFTGGAGLAVPEDLNDAGESVGHQHVFGSINYAVWWDAQDIPTALPGIPGGSNSSNWAHAINAQGQIVGYSQEGAPNYRAHAVVWQQGAVQTDLGFLGGGTFSEAYGINDLGAVVGVASVASTNQHAFLWQNGQFTDLSTWPGGGAASKACAINNHGDIVGLNASVASLWHNGSVQALSMPAGLSEYTPVIDINDAGDMIATASAGYPAEVGVLWHNGLPINLGTLPGGTISRARRINAAGEIVGEAQAANGFFHAVKWTLSAPATPFCFGDGSAGACPCGNSGASGRGCENSASTGGALLAGTGTPSLANDTLVLDSSGELPSVLSILLQGSTSGPAAAFGDGLRCAGARSSAWPCATPAAARSACRSPGTHRSPRSAALGDALASGATRHYQMYYRDPQLGFCPAPQGNSWNISSGLSIQWTQ